MDIIKVDIFGIKIRLVRSLALSPFDAYINGMNGMLGTVVQISLNLKTQSLKLFNFIKIPNCHCPKVAFVFFANNVPCNAIKEFVKNV